MLSQPPARMACLLPSQILSAAKAMAFNPDPQTRFTVVEGVSSRRPDLSAI